MFDTNRGGTGGRLARLITSLQDRIWAQDEAFAADRDYDVRRSTRGWTITVRDTRWDRKQLCSPCSATGADPITGESCPDCAGTGVVTLPSAGGRQ